MDNICIGTTNVKFDRETINNWTKKNPYTVFPSKYNIFGKNITFQTFYVYNTPIFDESQKKNFPCMEVIYKEDKFGNPIFKIRNSIRKWHFGKISTSELSPFQFSDCLTKLASILSVSNDFIMSLNVYRLEFGITFKLRPDGKRILFNIFEHPDYKKRKNLNEQGSFYLNSTNSTIIIYDKLKELRDNQAITQKTYSRISKHKSIIRMELRITKISGVDYAKKFFSKVQDLIYNWDLLVEYWKKQILKITYVDFLNEKEFKILLSKNKCSLQKYLVAKGLQYLGFENFLYLLDMMVINDKNRKYKLKKSILNIVKEMEGHKNNTTQMFVKSLVESVK